jgi:hypothetical protein
VFGKTGYVLVTCFWNGEEAVVQVVPLYVVPVGATNQFVCDCCCPVFIFAQKLEVFEGLVALGELVVPVPVLLGVQGIVYPAFWI